MADAPGPGAYNSAAAFDKRGGLMGAKGKDNFGANDGPGPGSY